MPTLSQATRQVLKSKAHSLKPVVLLGGKGLTDAVHAEIEVALSAHELIKIKLHAPDKVAREAMATEICESHQAEHVQLIGNMLTVYRKIQQV